MHVLLHVLLHIVMVHNIAAMRRIHCRCFVHSVRFVKLLLKAFVTHVAVVLLVSNQSAIGWCHHWSWFTSSLPQIAATSTKYQDCVTAMLNPVS